MLQSAYAYMCYFQLAIRYKLFHSMRAVALYYHDERKEEEEKEEKTIMLKIVKLTKMSA